MVTKVVFTAIDDLNIPSTFHITFEGKLNCTYDELKAKILSRISYVKNIQIVSISFDENYRV
jgi:hypothetical protein